MCNLPIDDGRIGDDEMIISQKEFKELLADSQWLCCLEAAGVDNWEGIDYAHKLWEEHQKKEKEESE